MMRTRKPAEPRDQKPEQLESWLEVRLHGKKALWKESDRRTWKFYCPFCGVSRNLRTQPKPGPRHVFQVALTSVLLAALLWPWFGARGLVFFLPLWVAFEVVFRLRVRGELSCDQCGFDPVLYRADVSMARREMESFWKKKLPQNGLSETEKELASEVLESSDKPSLTVEKA